MTAKPNRLNTMLAIPWYICAQMNSKELFSLSLCVNTLAGYFTSPEPRKLNALPRRLRRRSGKVVSRVEAGPSSASPCLCREQSKLEVSERVWTSSRDDEATRSWVAKWDPKNRLWGIIVAPRMPTAAKAVSTTAQAPKLGHTGIQGTVCKECFGGKKPLECISPEHVCARNNHRHADEHSQHLLRVKLGETKRSYATYQETDQALEHLDGSRLERIVKRQDQHYVKSGQKDSRPKWQ